MAAAVEGDAGAGCLDRGRGEAVPKGSRPPAVRLPDVRRGFRVLPRQATARGEGRGGTSPGGVRGFGEGGGGLDGKGGRGGTGGKGVGEMVTATAPRRHSD